jgi:hypothetical protein
VGGGLSLPPARSIRPASGVYKTRQDKTSRIVTQPGNRITTQPGNRITTQPGNRIITQAGSRITTQPESRITTQPGSRITITTQPEKQKTNPEARARPSRKPLLLNAHVQVQAQVGSRM